MVEENKEAKYEDTKEDHVKDWMLKRLLKAAENGEMEKVKLLCGAGAPVDKRGGKLLKTALHIVIKNGHLSAAEYLIKEAKADVNVADVNSNTALHLAAANDHTNVVKLLLDHGSFINAKGLNGQTALHRASSDGHFSTVECLVLRGASVDQQDAYGFTPLHLASYDGHIEIVPLLLKSGAHVSIKDKEGRTARDVAGYGCYAEEESEIKSFWDPCHSRVTALFHD